jgi:hypothetical protein
MNSRRASLTLFAAAAALGLVLVGAVPASAANFAGYYNACPAGKVVLSSSVSGQGVVDHYHNGLNKSFTNTSTGSTYRHATFGLSLQVTWQVQGGTATSGTATCL